MPQPAIPLAWLALAFAIFAFVVFTVRAVLNPDGAVLISDKRVFATALGGVIYWIAIREIFRNSHKPIGTIVLNTMYISVLGIALLLAVRSAIDALTLDDLSESFARNIRWILLWAGYFGAWVAGFMSLLFYNRLNDVATEVSVSRQAHIAARPEATAAFAVERTDTPMTVETLEWVAEAVAAEIARHPQIDRTTLIANLLRRSGYETTDAMFASDSAQQAVRLRLINKIGAYSAK